MPSNTGCAGALSGASMDEAIPRKWKRKPERLVARRRFTA
jgi:hypothetical protein